MVELIRKEKMELFKKENEKLFRKKKIVIIVILLFYIGPSILGQDYLLSSSFFTLKKP